MKISATFYFLLTNTCSSARFPANLVRIFDRAVYNAQISDWRKSGAIGKLNIVAKAYSFHNGTYYFVLFAENAKSDSGTRFSEPWFAPTLSQTLESTASLLGSINACNTFPYTLSWLEKKPLLILFSQLCAQHQPILPKSQIFDPKCSRLRVTRKSRYFDVLVLHDALSVCNN